MTADKEAEHPVLMEWLLKINRAPAALSEHDVPHAVISAANARGLLLYVSGTGKMRIVLTGAGVAALRSECNVSPISSRTCERGTNGCMVQHVLREPGNRNNFEVSRYWFAWDGEAQVFTGTASIAWANGAHSIMAQGRSVAEARAALDGAVYLTIKHWPPRSCNGAWNHALEEDYRCIQCGALAFGGKFPDGPCPKGVAGDTTHAMARAAPRSPGRSEEAAVGTRQTSGPSGPGGTSPPSGSDSEAFSAEDEVTRLYEDARIDQQDRGALPTRDALEGLVSRVYAEGLAGGLLMGANLAESFSSRSDDLAQKIADAIRVRAEDGK